MVSAPLLLGLLAALLFGLATPAAKLLLTEINPFLLAGLLYLGGAVGVLPMLYHERTTLRQRAKPTGRQLLYILGAIVCGGFLGPLLLLFGLSRGHAASVAVWLNMELVATAVLGVLLFNDHLDRHGWLGVALALLAGIIMTAAEGQPGWLAALLVTAACLCWGFDNHFTALIDCLTPAMITHLKGIFAGGVNLLLGIAIASSLPAPLFWLKALALGAFSYGLSIVCYVISAQHLGATRSQVLFSSGPLFGVGLAVLLLREPFLLAHGLAVACIAGGIYFSSRIQHSHRHNHQQMNHTHLHRHDDDHHNNHHDHLPDNRPHTHAHSHEPINHRHPHHPDMHHRHEHADSTRSS